MYPFVRALLYKSSIYAQWLNDWSSKLLNVGATGHLMAMMTLSAMQSNLLCV